MRNMSRVGNIVAIVLSVISVAIPQSAPACTTSLPFAHKESNIGTPVQADSCDLPRLNLETLAITIAPVDIDKDMVPNIAERFA